jgi:hypothetical protein
VKFAAVENFSPQCSKLAAANWFITDQSTTKLAGIKWVFYCLVPKQWCTQIRIRGKASCSGFAEAAAACSSRDNRPVEMSHIIVGAIHRDK